VESTPGSCLKASLELYDSSIRVAIDNQKTIYKKASSCIWHTQNVISGLYYYDITTARVGPTAICITAAGMAKLSGGFL
jgi:hypothetical protein